MFLFYVFANDIAKPWLVGSIVLYGMEIILEISLRRIIIIVTTFIYNTNGIVMVMSAEQRNA